jgi:hypothetical protein
MSARRVSLLLIPGLLAFLAVRVFFFLFVPESSQAVNERKVAGHIKAMKPQWEQFKATNSGFEFVEFWTDTRYEGSLGIRGCLASEAKFY